MARIETHRLTGWTEFKTVVYPTLFGEDRFYENRFAFRGMADESWQLISSFDRRASSMELGERHAASERLLGLFVEECDDDDSITPCPPDVDNQIAVAQHHGLPTRALDWSDSPYVAAFFAYFGAPTVREHEAPTAAIWALNLEHAAWNGSMGARLLRPSRRDDERMLRQRGLFSYLEAPFDSLEEYVEMCPGDEAALWKFVVPRSESEQAIADLAAMGITATRLFVDRNGAAQAALARFS
ncbi:MAG TPA: FRG domain-containing protein [Solirubrobacteraceae bacterium]|nr:FRG domain-containing protein [Solirubrobacteraceae bacterium]